MANENLAKFDGYINAIPLFEYRGETAVHRTRSLPLKAVRQDTGANPNETRPEYGDYFAQADFSGGSGQVKFHEPDSLPNMFYDSEGFDVSVKGKLTHLHPVADSNYLDKSVISFAVANAGTLYAAASAEAASANSVKSATDPATWTSVGPAGIGICQDVTSSGDLLYGAFNASGIRSYDGATWTSYVTGTVTGVHWGTFLGRIIAIGGTSSRSIYEVVTGGGAALPSALYTLPAGYAFSRIWENGPYLYAAAYSTAENASSIFHFGLNDAGTALIQKGRTPMPTGEIILGGGGYLGTIYLVGKKRQTSSEYIDIAYRCTPDDAGYLRLDEKLMEGVNYGGLSGIGTPFRILALGDHVLIPWTEATSVSDFFVGVLCHNLARNAITKHIECFPALSDAPTDAVFLYNNKLVFGGAGGITYENTSKYVATATLITSLADWHNAGQKTWNLIELTTDPLVTGTSVAVYYTTKHQDQNDWTLAGTHDTVGATSKRISLTAVESPVFALKLVSTANGAATAAPVILGFSVRSNPSAATNEYIVERSFRIKHKNRKHDRAPEHITPDPNAVVKSIEDLRNDWVTYIEQGFTYTARIEDVAVTKLFEPEYLKTAGRSIDNDWKVDVVMAGTRA